MYPYPGFHHWRRAGQFHRGPSRILWFVVGAASATWWIHKQHRTHDGRYFGHCFRAPIQSPVPQQSQSPPTDDGSKRVDAISAPPAWSPRNIPEAINNIPPAPWGFSQQQQAQQWEEEKERLLEIGRQAGDTMTELSEATLDSVLSTVEALKAKLAEHRAQREQQQKLLEAQLEEQKRQSRHIV